MPGFLLNRGFGFDQVIDQLYLGTEGIYGTPTFVSSTYIFLFILFGAFLEKAGMINLFNALALSTVGHTQGGPAKVAVISSGLMGTINGSGVANVLTVGQFTIPLMRRFGYRPAFAGAVEATSSMGGQIMPPVMGAVAFIMAETLNVPYSTIAITAAIPAFLYYASAFWMVHLEAGRHRLVGLPKDQCPSALAALRRDWHLILPLAALVYMLFAGCMPLFAGTVGLTLTIILILGTALVSPLGSIMARGGFWIALGLVGGALIASNALSINTVLFTIILTLGAVCLVARDRRATVRILITSLAEGAKSALGVGMSAGTVALCLVLGAKTVTLPTDHVTVAWHHSIEKTGWQEDYVIRGNRLVLTEARIQGTGARMEPPAGAVLRDGWFHYVPKLGPLPELRLTLSPYTADYRLCWNGQCRAVGRILDATAETAVVVVGACAAGPASGRPTTK